MYGPNVNQKILNCCFTTGLKKSKWGAEQKIGRNRLGTKENSKKLSINKKGKMKLSFIKGFKLQLNKYETVPYYFY